MRREFRRVKQIAALGPSDRARAERIEGRRPGYTMVALKPLSLLLLWIESMPCAHEERRGWIYEPRAASTRCVSNGR